MHVDTSNLDMLKDIIGDELKDVLNIYMETTPDIILKLQEAVATQSVSTVKLQAHTLKGSAANIGANQLSMISAELEQKAKHSDMDSLPRLLSKIESESRAVDLALADYLKTF
ncbi:MAG: Hpt domain-containing protein [Pseudomonadota bacterium]|nr:Hpt domain-containing protein [Pseudomonadota bacterium]